MAINACSIDGFTLHGRRCANKFAALIPILHPGAIKTGNGGGWFQSPIGHSQRERWKEPELPKNLPTELDQVTVTSIFQTLAGTDTQDVSNSRLDLVTVTDIHVNPVNMDALNRELVVQNAAIVKLRGVVRDQQTNHANSQFAGMSSQVSALADQIQDVKQSIVVNIDNFEVKQYAKPVNK
jgi:hypothetical protein